MRETGDVAPLPAFSGSEPQSDYTLTGSWMHVVSPNVVNTVRIQAVPTNTLLAYSPSQKGSEIDLGSQIQVGTPFAYPYDARWKRFQFDDNLSWIKGSHSLKFGESWRANYYSVDQKIWTRGQWQFTDGVYSILNIPPPAPRPGSGRCGVAISATPRRRSPRPAY